MSWRLAGFVVAALVLAACAGGRSRPAGPSGSPPPGLLAVIEELSDAQEAILADGEITYGEYEGAYLAYAECVRAAGGNIERGPFWDEADRDFHVWVGWPAASDAELRRTAASCWDETVGPLQDWWIWQEMGRPSRAELEERDRRFLDGIGACLRAAGYDVPTHPNPDELEVFADQDAATYRACVEEASPGFGSG